MKLKKQNCVMLAKSTLKDNEIWKSILVMHTKHIRI